MQNLAHIRKLTREWLRVSMSMCFSLSQTCHKSARNRVGAMKSLWLWDRLVNSTRHSAIRHRLCQLSLQELPRHRHRNDRHGSCRLKQLSNRFRSVSWGKSTELRVRNKRHNAMIKNSKTSVSSTETSIWGSQMLFFHVKLCVFFELQDVSKIQMFATECESKTHLISSDSMANSCSPSLLSPVIPCIQLRLIQTFEWICCNRFCASHHQGKQNGQNDMGTMWCYHQYYINYINIAKTMSRHV